MNIDPIALNNAAEVAANRQRYAHGLSFMPLAKMPEKDRLEWQERAQLTIEAYYDALPEDMQ